MARVANATIEVAGYGRHRLTLVEMNYALRVITDSVETKMTKGAYVKIATSGSFICTAACTSYEEWKGLCDWLRNWQHKAAQGLLGPARVICAGINFDRVGMIETPVPYGDAFDRNVELVEMGFIGASDLTSINNADVTAVSGVIKSEMDAAIKRDASVAFFYPGGMQMSGTQQSFGEYAYGTTTNNTGWLSPRAAERAQEREGAASAFNPPRLRPGVQEF